MATIDEGPETRTLSRRQLLIAGAGGAAAVAAARTGVAESAPPSSYPLMRVASLARLKPNQPVSFNYPLQAQPNVLIDMGQQVPGGVGPKSSIVAYSLLCQHMGCPVSYQASTRELVCPCHQTRYDPERLGSIIQGLAMTPLPRVLLRVRGNGVWAFGVTGLIYGYRSNLHPGTSVGV
jgi:arsenite oxidase small subunit